MSVKRDGTGRPELPSERPYDVRQLVFARNRLTDAALQIDLAIERDGAERGLRAGFAYSAAAEGMRELGRAERRLNRGKQRKVRAA